MAGTKTTSRVRSAPPSANGRGDAYEFTGPVRLGRRTKHLVKRLGPGDIAVIDHVGIDRVSGEDLVASGVRPGLVVVRGVGHKGDLRRLRPYVRDAKPVLVAVDGGADAILEDGFRPHMIVGDMDSASDAALRCGAELVVHAYPDGRAPGRERLDRLGLDYKVVPAPATSEDVAMLIAAELGAELLVAVGTHFNLVEFLDKARGGMSSTFLTRLRVGEILVDAKGVSRLYRPSAGP